MSFDANVTLQQLCGGSTGRIKVMVGGKNFATSSEENFVSFRFTAKAKNKANYCKITLTSDDLYTVEFGYIHAMKYTVRSVTKGLYCDMLKEHFESETCLALSL